MTSHIDPKILAKLRAFARRRRNLIIIRGICTAVAMLLATMMIVALIDWIFVLPDEARWALSGAAYLAVIIAEWRTCLRLLAHAPDPRKLARLVEHAEPKLREDLLSAVELGTTSSAEVFDSEQFRALVQSDVAARVENLDMGRLLPVNLLNRYLAFAGVIVLALILAFSLAGVQVGTLLMRALMPMGNFARVSKFQVQIVEPSPAERLVPHGDTIPLVIEVSGGRTNKAVLETFSETGGREVTAMSALEGDRFSATIQMAREDVEYRVRAGDAITKKYRLTAAARPHVVQFEKSYIYPEYSRVGVRKVKEENGDLAALEGTIAELRLETNQPIASGELRVEQGREQISVPIERQGDHFLARVPMNVSGTYRVFLVGAETGFENKFSPEYEIRAEPDLIPQVELESPRQDLIVPTNAIVDVQGTASDDQSLARVEQHVRVNDGAWQTVQLVENPGAKAVVTRRWDLQEQGVKAGDLVTTKLVAIDLKGSKGESRPLQLTITAAGFEANRLLALERQRQFWEAMKNLRTAAETLEKSAAEAREQFKQIGEEDPQRRQIVVAATTPLNDVESKISEARTQLILALRGSESAHLGGELVLLGRALARIDRTTAQFARDALNVVAENPGTPLASEMIRQFRDHSARTVQLTRGAEEAARAFLGVSELEVLVENSRIVAQEQDRLAKLAQNSGDDAAKWAPVTNRMRVVFAEARSLEAMMESAAPQLGGSGDRLRQFKRDLEKQRAALEKALANGTTKTRLTATANFTKATGDLSRRLLDFRRDQGSLPVRAFADLLRDTEPTGANFERLRQDVQAVNGQAILRPEVRGQLAGRRWQQRAEVFKLHADVEEQRPAADAFFVNDLRTATRAMQSLAVVSGGSFERVNPEFTTLDKSFRLLEGGHTLAELIGGLDQLAGAERWEITSARARTSNPRDWDWLEARLKAVPEELGKLQPAEPLKKTIDEAQKILRDAQRLPAAQSLRNEMKERMKPDRSPRAAPQDIERVAAQVRQALELLRAPMNEARAQIAELTPKLHELMAQLAKEAEQLREETAAQTEPADEAPEAAQAEARQTLAKQEQLNDKVDALKDALRSDANQQNVFEQEGRERARDADVATAMLKDPPPAAAAALEDAAQVLAPDEQKQSLKEAANQQQKLADALNQLAEHYENLAEGQPEETRLALRAMEEELGIKDQLDAQFARAEQMSQLAQESPEGILAKLEKALPQNPLMQKELSSITQNTLADSEQKLAEASRQEDSVAKNLEQITAAQDAVKQHQSAAQQVAEAAKQAAEAALKSEQTATVAEKIGEKMGNSGLDFQADKAADLAGEAAKAAQQAGQLAQQMNSDQPQKAMEASQKAALKAGEAAKKADAAAEEGKKAQAMAQKDAEKGGDQQANYEDAAKQAGEAIQLAEQAAQAANAAQKAAEEGFAAAKAMLAQSKIPAPPPGEPAGEQSNPQLAQAANQQAPIAQAAVEAGQDVSRAGRHEERLQNQAIGQQLQQLGNEIKETGQQEVPAAQQALTRAQMAADAQAPVNAASQALAAELAQLQAALSGPEASPSAPAGSEPAAAAEGAPAPPTGTSQPGAESAPPSATAAAAGEPPGEGSPAPGSPARGEAPQSSGLSQMTAGPAAPREQVWMARALDALDAALNAEPPTGSQPAQAEAGQQGANPSQAQPSPSQSLAAAAMAAAQQAAANAMRAQRSEAAAPTPGSDLAQGEPQEKSAFGMDAEGAVTAHQMLPGLQGLKPGDWGKLPKKVAEELTQGQREAVAGEYRSQVETYYRVIAEKSKKP